MWEGISVKGQSPGWFAHGVTTILADHVVGTAHDFTGASYGLIEGISFSGVASGAMVLNGKNLPRTCECVVAGATGLACVRTPS